MKKKFTVVVYIILQLFLFSFNENVFSLKEVQCFHLANVFSYLQIVQFDDFVMA